jgi:uncharacterized protein (TIGR03118 family)
MTLRHRRLSLVAVLLVAAAVAAGVATATTTATDSNAYVVHNLTSDVSGTADHTDPNLVNAWGLDAQQFGPWWVADNGTDLSTLYIANGTPQSLVVTVTGGPTGLVANPGTNFVISKNGHSGPSTFIFSNEAGKILGWNSGVTGTGTKVAVDMSAAGAIFRGLAIIPNVGNGRLYAADFPNAVVDVWDGNFTQIVNPGAFVDPNLPQRYAPFGIQAINGHVFVAYAKQDATKQDEIAGPHLGFVDEYDADGVFVARVASHGALNAPWGLAGAPDDFGRFSNDILVGNFGDGKIHAYTRQTDGSYVRHGTLSAPDRSPIVIDGLWALEFGKGSGLNGPTNTLFFTAGPQEETHGLFGSIVAQ